MTAIDLRLSRRGWRSVALCGPLLLIAAVALAGLPLWLATALVGGALVVGLTLLEPAFGLYAAILSVPVQQLVALPAGLTVTQAVVVLAFAAWTLRVLAHPERSLNLRLLAPWLLLLGAQLLSVALTPYSKIEGILQVSRWIAAFLAFVLTLGTITSRWRAWGLVIALLAGPAIAALIGLYQFVMPDAAPASFLILGGRFARASATFGKPNPFAGYLNMAWPLALALAAYFFAHALDQQTRVKDQASGVMGQGSTTDAARSADGPSARSPHRLPISAPRLLTSWLLTLLLAGVTLLLLAGLFASYSRGGWIGAVAGLGALALVGGRRTALLTGGVVLVGLLVGLLGAFSALPPAVTERLAPITSNLRIFDAGEVAITDDNFAIVERMAHWQAGWRMWRAAPLTGIGAGNYNVAYDDFYVAPWSISQGHAHNYYIHTLAESGLFGLIAYTLLISLILREAVRARRILRGTAWGAAAAGVCGIIAAVAGHNVFENLHVLNLGIQLSGAWGLAIVVQRLREERSP